MSKATKILLATAIMGLTVYGAGIASSMWWVAIAATPIIVLSMTFFLISWHIDHKERMKRSL